MKRVVCMLSLVALLFVGSVSVFADPYGLPVGQKSQGIPNPPIVTVGHEVSE